VECTFLSQCSPSGERRFDVLAIAGKWSGPALAALGLLGATATALVPAAQRSRLTWWILSSALVPERVLPLVGLGIALALVDRRYSLGALALFGGGVAVGFFSRDWLLSAIEAIPGATSHHFLTGPISSVTVCIALVLPGTRLRSWFLLIAAVVAGSMLAVAIGYGPQPPRCRDPFGGSGRRVLDHRGHRLTVRAFRRAWFPIPARILGSWLIAIGLLYGGVSLLPKQKSEFPLPAETMPNIIPVPGTSHPPPDLQPTQDRPGLGFPFEDPAGLQKP
jgi:hypothetical protein